MSNDHPLVCRFGALGDMVMITPLLKRLYERSGLPADIIAIGQWSQSLFECMPYVRTVHTIKSRKTPYLFNRPQQLIVSSLKQQAYDNAWLCESNKKSIWLFERGGVTAEKSISSFAFPRLDNEHFVEHWIRLADMSPSGCAYKTLDDEQAVNTMLFVNENEVSECRDWLASRKIDPDKPLVCIQAGNKRTTRSGNRKRSSNIKYWPESDWANIIDTIKDTLADTQILLCGIPSEQSLTLEIKELCRQQENIYSIADDLPLRRLMALMSIAHSCISVDTGPAHIAAALNCPLTVLVGKTDARVYSPKSSESKVVLVMGRNQDIAVNDGETSWREAHDMNLITPGAVINGWKESLE